MIPKIIHYCWFGRGEKPDEIRKCIETWHKYLPDYQFIEWNEDNFPVDYCTYTKQAYATKKYAFVSDVARLYGLYHYGGIYFDTDIEVRKPLDSVVNGGYSFITAFESDASVMTGFLAAEANNALVKEFLELYNGLRFEKDGVRDETPNTVRLTKLLQQRGLQMNRERQMFDDRIFVYTTEEIGAFDADSMSFCINDSTVLVHRCMASWAGKKLRRRLAIRKFLARMIGKDRYNALRRLKSGKRG